MPRRRVVQTGKTTRKWGVNNPVEVARVRKDGSQYTEWRVAYYAQMPYHDENGQVVGFERKRRYACSNESGLAVPHPVVCETASTRRFP